MRARGRRFSRRSSSKFQKLRTSWVTTIFDTGIGITGASLSGQILIDSVDWQGDVLGALNTKGVIRRVVASFGYGVNYHFTENAGRDNSSIIWGLWIEDDEEVDSQLDTSGIGDLWQENRFLASGLEVFSANGNDTDNPHRLDWSPHNQIDWKGRLTLKSNERLVLGHQCFKNVTGIVAGLEVYTVSRVLIEQP